MLARRSVGVRETARQLGCSRNTVRRYLNDPKAARYKPRTPREAKLEPFMQFSRREDFAALSAGLAAAFEYFGGMPAQVLFDNASTVIAERDAYGEGLHRWHAGLRELANKRAALLPLPRASMPAAQAPRRAVRPLPVESLQHPLSVYEALLTGAAA